MEDYNIEDLLPLVAELTQKYTLGESSSVTYQKANQLMEAVIYCINEYKNSSSQTNAVAYSFISAKEAYTQGYRLVLEKVEKAKNKYYNLIQIFCDYDNENYRDTFFDGISGFFKYYNAQFEPQNHIITMDYPVLYSLSEFEGIDAVDKYLDCISIEQHFMNKLPKEYVFQTLFSYQKDYRKQFYNICSIVLRNILACSMIKKKLDTPALPKDYQKLYYIINSLERKELEKLLNQLLSLLIEKKYEKDLDMLDYLKCDIKNFAAELINAAQNNCLEALAVL